MIDTRTLDAFYVFPKVLRSTPEAPPKDAKEAKHIEANMVVEARVTGLKRSHKRLEKIECMLVRVLSLCHSGRYLY